jgi:hypothetical protein
MSMIDSNNYLHSHLAQGKIMFFGHKDIGKCHGKGEEGESQVA